MSLRWPPAAMGVRALGALLLASCGWDTLDALGPAVGSVGVEDAATDAKAVAEDQGRPPSVEAGAAPDGVPLDSAEDTLGALEWDDAADAVSEEGSTSNAACMGNQSTVRQWTFDSGVQSWTLLMDRGVQGSLVWASTMGMPAPGALQVDVNPGTASPHGAWVRYDASPLGDLSGRIISAWLWLDSGPSLSVKLYVQTGTEFVWADNGSVALIPDAWTCLSMAVSSPSYTNGSNYDPTNVVRVGFELDAPPSSPFRVYVDTVGYY